jgi:membrane-bound ClpP family serine protease
LTGPILLVSISLLVAWLVVRSLLKRFYSHRAELLNSTGVVSTTLDPLGAVLVKGELWLACAVSGKTIAAGSRVRVTGVSEHLLLVST